MLKLKIIQNIMGTKSKKTTERKKSIFKKYSFEFLILFLLTTGVFLLFENLEIKSTILYYINVSFKSILQFIQNIFSSFSRFLLTREGSDIIRMMLLFTTLILLYFRYHKIARILFVKVKHYFCEKCNTSILNFR